jgi:stress response protein SCP2
MQTQLVPGANAALQDPHVRVDVSWSQPKDPREHVGLCIFFLNAAGMMRGDQDAILSEHPIHPQGAARIAVNAQSRRLLMFRLDLVEPAVEQIVLVLTIPKASPLHIGHLQNIQLTADSTPLTIQFDATEPTSAEQSMTLAKFYKYRDQWRILAVAQSISDSPNPHPWISQAKALGFIA